MADKNTLRNWFLTNLKPTQTQFWALFDSYFHKDEKIPITAIDNIEAILAQKADAEVLTHHLTNATAHADLFLVKEDKSKRGAALGYVPLNEFVKIASDYLNLVNDLFTGGATALLSAEQGVVLQNQINAIKTLLVSDNLNLDNVQELVDAIETVQTSLSTILVNDLTTGGTTKALTAEMGKTLKGLIDGLVVPTATDTVRGLVKTDVTKADPTVYTVETTDNLLKAKVNAILEIKPITGIAYTLIAYDTANLVQLAYDGTLPMTVTIPNDATLNLPVGSIFYTVGSNTGALTIAGGAGVIFQTAVGLTAGQNETRKYVKKAANTWQVEGGAQPMAVGGAKIYKTYFVNTSTGNNTTGVYEDSTKPYASIDYVLALPAFKSGDIIWLQNENGNFAWNSNFTGNKNFTIKSDVSVTLNFSSHAPGYIASGLSGGVSIIKIDLPVGTIYNERSGGTGIALRDADGNERIMLNINANYIYWNCSTTAGVLTGLKANKVSTKGNLFLFSTNVGHIFISEIECLSNDTSFATGFKEITIGKITGSGSFAFAGNDAIWNVGDVLTTGKSYISFGTGSRNTVNWIDSIISSTDGIELGSYYVGNTVHTGTIRSCAKIYFYFAENNNNNVYFKNFTADLGTGTIRANVNNISFENCSIKSLNSPVTFVDYGLGSLTIKNSSFEVVNAVPLVTGGAGTGKTVKIAGLSTNATMISDQNGTGVTVTQFTNY